MTTFNLIKPFSIITNARRSYCTLNKTSR